MDVVRSCYKTSMKLWKDRDELTPVRWFFVEPAAKVFQPVSSFRSLKTWDRESDRTGMTGEKNTSTVYDKGSNPLGFEGLRHCGSDLAMQEGGESSRDPIIETGLMGDSPCCKTPPTVGICLSGSSAPWKTRLPHRLLCQIIGPLSCPEFNGLQLILQLIGTGTIQDLSTPGNGTVFVGLDCTWNYISALTLAKTYPNLEEWMVLGVALSANGIDVPSGCPEENCRIPRIYWKVLYKTISTGTWSVAIRTEQNFDPVISPQDDPLQFFLSDGVAPASVFGCQLGGSDPLTRCLLRFTRVP